MADYVSTTYMRSYNPKRTYDTTSRPTLAQVGSYIAPVSAKMDAVFVGAGITVPVTTSATHPAGLYVKYIAALGVAGFAEESAFMGGNKNESDHAKSLLDRFYSELDMIASNPKMLSGLISGVISRMDSYELSTPGEARTDVDDEPFARDVEYW